MILADQFGANPVPVDNFWGWLNANSEMVGTIIILLVLLSPFILPMIFMFLLDLVDKIFGGDK